MKILDQHGSPIDTGILREPQTARVAVLQHELVQSQLDGLTPAKAARILKEADTGNIVAQHQLFDDMYDRDAHLRCEFDKRRGAVLGLDWSIEPPANASRTEKKLAAWVEEILRDVVDDLEDVILAMMDAVGHGFAPVEIEWERWGTEWLPKFHPRPQTWFQLDTLRRNLRVKDGSSDGAEPIPMGWILHQHVKAKTGYLGRMGLSRVLVWPFLYKAYSVGDFAEFLETYGLPIIVGKYPQSATPEEKSSLMRAVTALGHDARAIMPEQMAIEIQKITGSGSGTPHLEMVNWADGAQSKAILGQVLSAEAKATGLGSGVADLHAEVRRDILIADSRQIAGTLTRDLVYPLIALNQGGLDSYRRCPRWVFDLGEAEDLKLYSEALPALAQGGARIPVSWVHEKLRIPEAAEDEAVFGAAPNAAPNAPVVALTARYRAAALASRLETGPAPDPADLTLPPLAAQAEAQINAWRNEIEAMLAAAGSLEEFREQLLARYEHLPAEELVTVMATALSAIELAGRSEVQDGR
ncbi:DUF935 domain-containing protein [Aromatoleum toluclasticum]|uniref:DUF935 domain-containing protein n=1 Tax=Aromatoleum toluclasticum TaxID=92003 RepID=UPI001D18B593|nr:DUF935 domain-containing protein [Aromatoleum toluclasticum]MCC4116359.1 DUF935 domain-containing protein [Aromatoleum toluclasticum]